MKYLTLIAFLFLALPAHGKSDPSVSAWNFVCKEAPKYGASCEGVPAPKWERLGRIASKGAAGGYKGGDVVEIRDKVEGIKLTNTLVHEYMHYLLHVSDVIPLYTMENACASEDVAWTVSNRHYAKSGHKDLRTARWWMRYENCGRPE